MTAPYYWIVGESANRIANVSDIIVYIRRRSLSRVPQKPPAPCVRLAGSVAAVVLDLSSPELNSIPVHRVHCIRSLQLRPVHSGVAKQPSIEKTLVNIV